MFTNLKQAWECLGCPDTFHWKYRGQTFVIERTDEGKWSVVCSAFEDALKVSIRMAADAAEEWEEDV